MENGIQTGVYEDLITNGRRVELSNAPSSRVASEQKTSASKSLTMWEQRLSSEQTIQTQKLLQT